MQELRNRVAVITGAASGMGRAIAARCAREGMRVVLAGINEENLKKVEAELRSNGATVLSVRVDVSVLSDVEALARETLDAFGAVHLLVNNAGVVAGASPWESTASDWQWVIDVNLSGAIHGVKVFAPIMLGQKTEGHIVNNASAAGLINFHPSAPYQVTKAAVVALSENLYHWLSCHGSLVGASVLCTGPVASQIGDSRRNRPAALADEAVELDPAARMALFKAQSSAQLEVLSPAEVADVVIDGVREGRFYLITHQESGMPLIRERMEDLLAARNPRKLGDIIRK